MRVHWPVAEDRPLVDALRNMMALEGAPAEFPSGALLFHAERHGVRGLLCSTSSDAYADARARAHAVARRLEHDAHLALLTTIDASLSQAGIDAVLLKGVALAERLYPEPWTRPTSDVDLLVREDTLEATRRALETIGYVWEDSEEEARYRREHHHLHLFHPHALPVELHFHAYQGFGRVMRSGPLLDRRRPFIGADGMQRWKSLSVLSPADEFVYLAVHAAAHRFVRLGWLCDLRLLLATMTTDDVALAAERARELGYLRATAMAARLLVDVLGEQSGRLAPLCTALGEVRSTVVARLIEQPTSPVVRSASRFVFTASLCDSSSSALRYARQSASGHLARLATRAS